MEEYRDYQLALLEPIVTISGFKATADIDGFASPARNSKYYPTGNFGTVFYLGKVNRTWTITTADDFTEAEFYAIILKNNKEDTSFSQKVQLDGNIRPLLIGPESPSS